MNQIAGIGTRGWCVGNAHIVHFDKQVASAYQQEAPQTELAKVQQAFDEVKKQLESLSAENDIFAAHLEILEDPLLFETLQKYTLEEQMSAPSAIGATSEELVTLFKDVDDEYLQARADDVKDVLQRIQAQVLHPAFENPFANVLPGSIIVAEELLPSHTAQMNFSNIVGLITQRGSRTSHVCIIASSKGIPALVSAKECMDAIQEGDRLLLNASKGYVIIHPTEQDIKCVLTSESQNPSYINKDHCFANAGSLSDVQHAMQQGAQGIGLFRSEFVYMESASLPSEDAQFNVYYQAAQLCQGKPLTIRTLDVGGDKQLPYLPQIKEENPFLGVRGIRYSLQHLDVFKTQIKAILRASVLGNVRMMFPMISLEEELDEALALVAQCKEELTLQHIPFDENMPVGIMIETPAAVFIADRLAQKCKFFSIGTNDLTQYLLAADRNNSKLGNAYHADDNPSLLKAIAHVCACAEGIDVCVCGEMASNPQMAPQLFQAGVKHLSVQF